MKMMLAVLFVVSSVIIDVQSIRGGDFAVYESNRIRKKYANTPNLHYDRTLEAEAEHCAKQMLDQGTWKISYKHPCNPGFEGENIYQSDQGRIQSFDLMMTYAVEAWEAEIQKLDEIAKLPSMTKDLFYRSFKTSVVGHFTQMIWKHTTRIGCGGAEKLIDGKYKHLIVCRYTPKGNDYTPAELEANLPKFEIGTHQSSCVDKLPDHCPSLKGRCETTSFVKENCHKTCGVCSAPGGTTSNCEDLDPQCEKAKSYCHLDTVNQKCERTCGMC